MSFQGDDENGVSDWTSDYSKPSHFVSKKKRPRKARTAFTDNQLQVCNTLILRGKPTLRKLFKIFFAYCFYLFLMPNFQEYCLNMRVISSKCPAAKKEKNLKLLKVV